MDYLYVNLKLFSVWLLGSRRQRCFICGKKNSDAYCSKLGDRYGWEKTFTYFWHKDCFDIAQESPELFNDGILNKLKNVQKLICDVYQDKVSREWNDISLLKDIKNGKAINENLEKVLEKARKEKYELLEEFDRILMTPSGGE